MKFTLYRDQAGEWRWRLAASNGRIVADCGEGYKRFGAMLRTMRRIFADDEMRAALRDALKKVKG